MKWISVLFAVIGLFLGLCNGVFAEEYETDANTLALYHFTYGNEWTDSAAKYSTQTLYEVNVIDNNHLWPITTGFYGDGYYLDGFKAKTGLVSSLRLDGADRMPSLLAPNAASWSNGFTYEMMVKPSLEYNSHGPAGSDWIVLAELSGTVTIYAYQTVYGLRPCVAMQCVSETNGLVNEVWFVASPSNCLELNEWGHMAFTFDQANHIAKIWINGEVAASENVSGLRLRNKSGWPLTIGNRWSDDSLLSGTVDEIRLSNIARDFSDRVAKSSLIGKINLSNYNGDITSIPVTFELGNGIDPIILYLDADGRFTINDVPNGVYDIHIKASHWLRKTIHVEINGE